MSLLFNDTYTGVAGTDLTSHTPDTGIGWTLWQGAFVLTDANRARCSALAALSNPAYYVCSATPSSADYDVSVDIFVDTAGGHPGPIGRATGGTGGNSTINCYGIEYRAATSTFFLFKIVSGGITTLGSNGANGITTGTTATVMLRMRGTTISVLKNGVSIISVTDSTFSAAGSAGITDDTTATNSTNSHFDNFQVNDTVTGIFIPKYLTGGFKTLSGGIRG